MKPQNMLIDADELIQIMNDKNIRIFDASATDDVYLEEHIPGAAYFDHDRFSDASKPYEWTILPADKLAEAVGKAGIANDSMVILYACGMIPFAARAWWVLRYAGHDNVRVLNGGLYAWKKAGGQTEQPSRHYEPAFFKGNPRYGMFVNKEEVIAALEDDSTSVINVLPLQSYEGAHITGSANLSCMDLMIDLEYILPIENIQSRLEETSKYKRIITYCGGGVAAALSAMAHLMVGQDNVAVYDGSMNEWIGEGMPVTGNGKWEIWKP